MNYSITQNGKPLDKSKYTIDEENKTFSTEENNLVLDFTGLNDCTFETGYGCVVVRKDIYEVIELKEREKIQLNKYLIKGYKVLTDKKKIIIDGKEIEISIEDFEEIKKLIK